MRSTDTQSTEHHVRRAGVLAESGEAYVEQMRGCELDHGELATLFEMIAEELRKVREPDASEAVPAEPPRRKGGPPIVMVPITMAVPIFAEIAEISGWLLSDIRDECKSVGTPVLQAMLSNCGRLGYIAAAAIRAAGDDSPQLDPHEWLMSGDSHSALLCLERERRAAGGTTADD